MPTTRPSDKDHENAQWWKEAPDELEEGEIPDGPTAFNKDGSGKNKFDQEQEPVKHPT
jgi:hypothetical protein